MIDESLKEFVKAVYKLVKLVNKINSNLRESKTYNEIINNLINENK